MVQNFALFERLHSACLWKAGTEPVPLLGIAPAVLVFQKSNRWLPAHETGRLIL